MDKTIRTFSKTSLSVCHLQVVSIAKGAFDYDRQKKNEPSLSKCISLIQVTSYFGYEHALVLMGAIIVNVAEQLNIIRYNKDKVCEAKQKYYNCGAKIIFFMLCKVIE